MLTRLSSVPGRLRLFALVGLQLALLLLIVHRFDVETQKHFFAVLCLAVGGFAVHVWLPQRFRAMFFVLVSLAGILFVLGWPNGAWVLGLGGGLIALCSLPIPLGIRIVLLAVAGVQLALLRLEYHDEPFWPVLGSMFMFRLIVYLFEQRRAAGRPPLMLTLAYFFPLPNVCFLFFPILDFKTFRQTYRADAPWETAQTGVGWIARGLSHLLAYRVIKYYVLPAPFELGDLPHLALFLAANYALYLHVSGCFHIVTGIFHLFGFELPRTHHNYFLASSFTDIWRRINIYWKDFMMKLFFFPAFFALRGWGTRTAVAAAALVVFLATWLLHAYQIFWITGGLSFSLYNAILWLVVGVLVAGNLQLDLTRLRGKPERIEDRGSRIDSGARSSILDPLWLSLRVVAMFVLVSFFWACWNTPKFLQSLQVQAVSDRRALAGGAAVLGVLLVAVGVGVVAQLTRDRLARIGLLPLRLSPTASALALTAALVVVALLAVPQVAEVFGPRATGVIAALRRESATPAEAALALQGYYEEILDARVPTGSWLAALEGRPPPPRSITYTEMTRPADDLLERELIPGWSGAVDGIPLTINRFGMRDRLDRSRQKPAHTCRVAVVGSSVVMGYGVGDDEPFPRLLEDRLNARRQADDPHYELLNFGTGKSYVIQRHVLFDRKVLGFEPDALFYVAHQDELIGPVPHLAKLVAQGHPLPYPCLTEVVRRAGIAPGTSEGMTQHLLKPLARDIVLGVYRDLIGECRRRGIRAVWIWLPIPGVAEAPDQSAVVMSLAEEAGFVVVTLADWADGRRPVEVKRSEADYHPNALGHQLLAERLDAVLRQRPELLPAPARGRP
jgi:hypothetical protein